MKRQGGALLHALGMGLAVRPRSLGPLDLARFAVSQVEAAAILRRAGLLHLFDPAAALRLAAATMRWGISPLTAFEVGRMETPDRAVLIDDDGPVTFDELELESDRLAARLRRDGVGEGVAAGILSRNHRGWVRATLALWKLGADTVYLNTALARPELEQVAEDEGMRFLIHDAEFGDVIPARLRSLTIDAGLDEEPADPPPPPGHVGRTVILTSGTSGRPKGAPRGAPGSLEPAVSFLSRIPLRARETTLIAPPLFHAWGFANLLLALVLRSTFVLQTKFDAEAALAAAERHRVTAMIAVPVMLERILELPARTRRRYDTSSLRVVAVSGSALAPAVAEKFMAEFGRVLYNLYGSTEVAWASIATPTDLVREAGTAGRPPRNTVVRILNDSGQEVPQGETGKIYVGNDLLLESYTGGEKGDAVDGLLATGDLGHFDASGRLFVEGRADDMIVSGGENVYPGEVEDLLKAHPKVADATVVGVDDERFGQVLWAFVVPRGRRASDTELLQYVGGKVARFKVPKRVVFVESVPRNPAGKVHKQELLQAAGKPAEAEPQRPPPRRRSTARPTTKTRRK